MTFARLRSVLAGFVPWLLLGLAVALVAYRLRSPAAILPLYRPWAEIGALACGMTAIMLTGGIDLSVGSIVGLAGVVLGLLWRDAGVPIGWAALAAVGVGTLAGLLNAGLIAVGIAPLVATLATMALNAGLALALSQGDRVAGLPTSFTWLGQGWIGPIPTQLILFSAVATFSALIVHATRFGRTLFALGDNRLAAVFAAVPVRRTECWLYTLNGTLAGLVALAYTARGGAAVPNAGTGLELQVIACVVLGGTRVNGGAGGIGRTVLGVLVLAHLEIGLRLWSGARLPLPWSDATWSLNANGRLIVVGVLLIAVAVVNERFARTRSL